MGTSCSQREDQLQAKAGSFNIRACLTLFSTYVDFDPMTQARKFSDQTLVLLAALIEQPRKWRHGYDLSKDTGLKSGTLYPIMMRLGDRGFLESKWEDSAKPGRPPRHVYRLTTAGSALAKALSKSNQAVLIPGHTVGSPA